MWPVGADPPSVDANKIVEQYFATIGVADDEMQMDKQQFYSESKPKDEPKEVV